MLAIEVAWAQVVEMVERAAAFGRIDRRGGTTIGWDRTPPGKEPLVDFMPAWLRHEIFEPLDERDVEQLQRRLGHSLPGDLQRFYIACANGANLASGDLAIYGVRRGLPMDPYELLLETLERPQDAAGHQHFFGAWGDERNLLYQDERDGRVHLSGLISTEPLRTWSGFGEFLVESLDELLDCWDLDGRRIGTPVLPQERAQPAGPRPRQLAVPAAFLDRSAQLIDTLAGAPDTLAVGDSVIELAPSDDLDEAQVGYSIDRDGDSLLDDSPGAWQASWIVIGTDQDLGDPYFVDLADAQMPVLTALHGTGTWTSEPVAPSLRALLDSD
jgi:hypothetical protein